MKIIRYLLLVVSTGVFFLTAALLAAGIHETFFLEEPQEDAGVAKFLIVVLSIIAVFCVWIFWTQIKKLKSDEVPVMIAKQTDSKELTNEIIKAVMAKDKKAKEREKFDSEIDSTIAALKDVVDLSEDEVEQIADEVIKKMKR